MDQLKYKWRAKRPELISGLLYSIARAINRTLRMKVIHPPEDLRSVIICGWHGRTFAFANLFRNKGVWVMISHSRDGEIQKNIFERFGFNIIRGSTGRGGVKALKESIRVLKDGGAMAMTPDGPRGPSGIVQDGVMVMAQKSGAKLIPAAFSASPVWKTKSWDKYIIPRPFARAVMLFGDPITVALDATSEEAEAARLRLQEEMHRLECEADRMTGLNMR